MKRFLIFCALLPGLTWSLSAQEEAQQPAADSATVAQQEVVDEAPVESANLVRRTYLWDVTLSMKGAGGTPNIWEPVKEALINEIKLIDDESVEIVIVPFQHKVIEIKRAMATSEGKASLISFVEGYKLPKLWTGDSKSGHESEKGTTTMTKLHAPLQYCMDNIFGPDKVDILEMMTDGLSDFPEDGQSFMKLIKDDWCDLAKKKNLYAFYVMLTPNAVNQELSKVTKDVCRFDLISPGDNGPSVSIVELIPPKNAVFNIHDDAAKEFSILFKRGTASPIQPGYKVNISFFDNPYMEFDDDIDLIVNPDFTVKFTPELKMSLESLNQALLSGGQKKIKFTIKSADGMDQHPFQFIRVRDVISEMELTGAREKKVTLRWK